MQLEARLRAFAAVAREGSFSRAADALHVSQPAVSKHVAALEAEVGATLVERRRGGATLTPAGRVLADYALRAEAQLTNARRALDALVGEDAGVVLVAASGIPADHLLPRVLPAFLARNPRATVEIRATTSADALARVRAHEVDLAVLGGFGSPTDLESEPLVDDEIVLIGPPDLGGRPLRRSDLQNLTWISRDEGSATRAAAESARWQLGLGEVHVVTAPSWSAVKELVAAGGGIAPISELAVEHEVATGALAILDVPQWRLRRTISVVAARDVPLTPAAASLRGALRSLAGGLAEDAREDGLALASRVAEAAAHIEGIEHATWAARLEELRPSVDAAVSRAVSDGDWELVARLLGPAWRHWIRHEYPDAWRRALEQVVSNAPRPAMRLLALPTLGWLAYYPHREFDAAARYAELRLEAARAVGDDGQAADALTLLAAIATDHRHFATARDLLEQAVALDRRSGQDDHLARHLSNLAGVLIELGALDAAERAATEVGELGRGSAMEQLVPDSVCTLAIVELLRGDAGRALELLLSHGPADLVDDEAAWWTLELVGLALGSQGQLDKAAQILALAELLSPQGDGPSSPAMERLRDDVLAAARTELGNSALGRAETRGRKLTPASAFELARTTRAPRAARRSSTPGASRSSSSRARRARR